MRRLSACALLLFAGLAAAGPEEMARELAGATRVEKLLRAEGLSPGKQAPPAGDPGEWALEVRSSAQGPLMIETQCMMPLHSYVSPVFEGERFVYEAHNEGEWGGQLTVRKRRGPSRVLLRENVIAMVPDGRDLYVFSGLDHGSDHGGVHVIENFDSRPRFESISRLPGTPLAIGPTDDHLGGFLVVTRFSVTRIFAGNSIEVLMARHATLRTANSVLAVGRSQILVGMCGGVAQVQLPWYMREPDADYEIPVVTYWTRQ